MESTACDLKYEPAEEGESQLSILPPRARQGRETQQRAVRQRRRLEEAAETVTDVPRVAPVHTTGVWNSLAVELRLITRTLLKHQLVIENLEDRLNSEIEQRDRRKR